MNQHKATNYIYHLASLMLSLLALSFTFIICLLISSYFQNLELAYFNYSNNNFLVLYEQAQSGSDFFSNDFFFKFARTYTY